MRIFVSSGSSYVGRHLIKFLINCGNDVMYSWASFNPFPKNDLAVNIDYLRVDPLSVDRVVEFNPDVIVLATGAYTGDTPSLSIVNISSAVTVAQIALRCGTKTVIHLSSLSVYGWPLPENLDDAPPNPSDDYGKSKYCQEVVLSKLEGYADSIVNIRLPVVLGPGAHRAWLPTVKDLMSRNAAVEYSNPLDGYSSFTTVSAVCTFVVRLIESCSSGCSSFPIGGIAEMNVREMLFALRALLNSKSKLVCVDSDIKMAKVHSGLAVQKGYVKPNIDAALKEFLYSL
jgi:nucleoside-diphosphate-sugar epimerase